MSQVGIEQMVSARIQNVTGDIGNWLRLLAPLLSPIYWTTAYEIGPAANGYTTTKGFFRRETQVNFVTGQTLHMTHVARGLDKRGVLLVDIVISGEVPDIAPSSQIALHPYTEDYVQIAPGIIYAFSTRTYEVNGHILPYLWNHTIYYDEILNGMPFPTQRLYATGINSYYDDDAEEMRYNISAAIGKGYSDSECVPGFFLSSDGLYCLDIDECKNNGECSHTCNNFLGGFSCQCLKGFSLDLDGKSCDDINECELNLSACPPNEECINTFGSYKCLIICRNGYVRSEDELFCKDINECDLNIHNCSQICSNNIGSYSCSCSEGYQLINEHECLDIDECSLLSSPCSHFCTNTPGHFVCSCLPGFKLQDNINCMDIDECQDGTHSCPFYEECKNTIGGFECYPRCAEGLVSTSNGSCIDINECETSAECHITQVCVNTYGSYYCTCIPGYTSAGPGQPCLDFNECDDQGRCQHICENTPGSYRCICPPGYQLEAHGKNCHDIDECFTSKIDCGPDRMCFNTRGSYECIETPCPPKYDRDPITGYCILECEKDTSKCSSNIKYSEILAFKTIALPSGIQAYQDLIRLVAYDQNGIQLPNTVFSIIENDSGVPFRIRLESGKGVLYTQKSMESNTEHKIKVQAISLDVNTNTILYKTKFLVFVSVSQYPY